MTFQEFLQKYNGQSDVGNTNENIGQCTGLVNKWTEELRLPFIWGHAFELFANADEQYYEKILNTPEAIPQQGDIVVWNREFNGTFGHTAIATGTANLTTFEAFEQNDPLGSNSHLKTYPNYKFVIGFLRPKITADCDPSWRLERDKNWDLYQASEITVKNLQGQLQTAQNDVSNKDKQLLLEQQANETLRKQANQLPKLQEEFNTLKGNYDTDKIRWNAQAETDKRTIAQLENSSYKTLPTGELIKIVFARIFRIK